MVADVWDYHKVIRRRDESPAITHQPDLAFTCLHPYSGSSMAAEAARKSWRRNQIKKTKKKPPNLSHLRAKKKKNTQDVSPGEPAASLQIPPQPLSLFPFHLKRRPVIVLMLMENDSRSLEKKKITVPSIFLSLRNWSADLWIWGCKHAAVYVKNQINLLPFLSLCLHACLPDEATFTETRTSSPHPHRCSYLPCLCVWCCWPPSESPGVFYVSPGDRTPCVVVDCDGEDLRKSRFAVLLRRPSFSSLLLDAWAAFAFKSPLFPSFFFFFLTQRSREDESSVEGESDLGIGKYACFLRTGKG